MSNTDSEYKLVLCTCPNSKIAQELANKLVAGKLAACVNVVPKVISVYEWDEKVTTEDEQLLIIKTLEHKYPSLEKTILDEHPYDCPEVICIPIETGATEYLSWLTDSLG